MSTGSTGSTVRRVGGYSFMAVAVALLVVAVARNWAEFTGAVASIDALSVVAAGVTGAAALGVSMLSWRESMAASAPRLPVGPAAHTYFVSQLGKYVPGSVWPVLAQMELMHRYGVGKAQSAVGSTLAMVVGLASAIVVGFGGIAVAGAGGLATYWWLALPAQGCALLLIPPVLVPLLRFAARLGGRFAAFDSVEIDGRALFRSVLWSLLSWAGWGTQAWWLLRAFAGDSGDLWWQATGAYAVSWAVGFVIVFAPGGIGPREAVLVALLGTTAGATQALAVALITRVLMTLLDLVGAGLAVLVRRFGARGDAALPDPQDVSRS